jgi:signal transduction histidine kinase
MRSLYLTVLLAMLVTLSVSLAVFVAISDRVTKQYIYPVFEAMDELELESARNAWEASGISGLAAYVERLNHHFGTAHYILNAQGVDLVSGQNRADLLPSHETAFRGWTKRGYLVTHRSSDGLYWLVAVDPRQPGGWSFSPYYGLVVGVTGLLCCLAAVFVVLPIRRVTAVVERFGHGDLSVRANMKRKDEIGALARSFDAMAERMETLVMSERRLLQDISHELRSPLTRLKLAIRLTRTAADPNVALDRVQRETDRITTLVSEIVEMTRMEGDPHAHKMEPLSLGQVMQEAVEDCGVEAQLYRGCGIRVDGRLTGEVSGNRELLRRAVENVLRNAIHYSPERGSVDVRLAENQHGATITIRDYGPGVPSELLLQVFEPFFRVEEARDGDSGGIGLGLSIAKRAVRLHQGTIRAQNAFPGLQVEIALPTVQPASEQQREDQAGAGSL